MQYRGDLLGQRLGNCTLERLLGKGGMGAVYLARQERPARQVAVKVLSPNLPPDDPGYQEFLTRFRREADVIAQLEHVNIMPIYEYGEQGGLAYLVMPYISGGSLRDVLVSRGALSLQDTLTYIDQATSALDYAHSKGVVHRDLKPANFLLHPDGRLVLADFGIARIIEENAVSGSTLTSAGTILGTPEYMAPEMATGGNVDYRADIYELGIVLFQMLNGRVPFSGTTPYAVVLKHMQSPLPFLSQTLPNIPPAVDAVIQKATAKQPDDRYQSGRAMAQALRQASTASTTSTFLRGDAATIQSTAGRPPLILPASNGYQAPATPSQVPYDQRYPNQPQPSWTGYPAQGNYPPQATGNYAQAQNYTSYPGQGAPYTPPPPRQRQPWGWVIAILLVVLLVGGGVALAAQLNKQNQGNAPDPSPTAATTQPTTGATATPQATATATTAPTPSPTTAPTPSPTATQVTTGTVPVGAPIYNANKPGPGCDSKGGEWVAYNTAQVTCLPLKTRVIFNGDTQGLQGILLNKIPGQDTYPNDYVVQVQAEQNGNGEFGIYFRNVPGKNNLGVYTFLIHPDGTWDVTVYDNAKGTPTQLKNGTLGVDPKGKIRLAVSVKGQDMAFFINGQPVGTTTDNTYPAGTVGMVVGPGSNVSFNEFSLNAPAA